MKTAVTIPWETVVNGCPPSRKARELPLVVAKRCSDRGDYVRGDDHWDEFIWRIQQVGAEALAVAHGTGPSTRIELLLSGSEAEAVATLTSDGESSAVLQALCSSWATHDTFDPDLATDALVRTFVLRYARFDADAPALVLPSQRGEDCRRPVVNFLRPENWGFRPTRTGSMAWTASHLTPPHNPFKNAYCSTRPVLLPAHRTPLDLPQTPSRPDPLQCLPLLRYCRDVLERQLTLETGDLGGGELCYWPTLALGRCRLFGVGVDASLDFTLGIEPFMFASRYVARRLKVILAWSDRIDRLRDRGGAYREQNLALELLEARTDAHAAHLALDEAYAAALYDGSPQAPAMSRRLHQVRRLINLFDNNLRKNLPLLRLAASTYLLDNWRRLLAPGYRDCSPWWLDGCIG